MCGLPLGYTAINIHKQLNTRSMENNKPNIYQLVTDRIIASLERGCVPWKQPWVSQCTPANLVTARPYRGINTWLLRSLPFESRYFLSIEQVNRLGGKVKKGEKSCPVVFWKRSEKEDEQSGETKLLWLMRYYNVFNVEQCSGIPAHFIPPTLFEDNDPIDSCKKIIQDMPSPPDIFIKAKDAFYVPETDTVHMPNIKKFKNSEAYYGTLFHELIHSTGHASRLNREGVSCPEIGLH